MDCCEEELVDASVRLELKHTAVMIPMSVTQAVPEGSVWVNEIMYVPLTLTR